MLYDRIEVAEGIDVTKTSIKRVPYLPSQFF